MYLGRWKGQNGLTLKPDEPEQDHDLYFCTQCGFMPTVIARYSDDPSHYYSGLEFGKRGIIVSLEIAYNRAKERGLIK